MTSVQSKTSRRDRSVSLFIFRNTWLEYFESDAVISGKDHLGTTQPCSQLTVKSFCSHKYCCEYSRVCRDSLSATSLQGKRASEESVTSSACMKHGAGIGQAAPCPPLLQLLRTQSQPPMEQFWVPQTADAQKLQLWEAAEQNQVTHGAKAYTNTAWGKAESALSPAATCRPRPWRGKSIHGTEPREDYWDRGWSPCSLLANKSASKKKKNHICKSLTSFSSS